MAEGPQRGCKGIAKGLQRSCRGIAKGLQSNYKGVQKGYKGVYTDSLQRQLGQACHKCWRGQRWAWGQQPPMPPPVSGHAQPCRSGGDVGVL